MNGPRLATVVYGNGESDAVDALLGDVVRELRARGLRVAGAVQHNTGGHDGDCYDMLLEDAASGRIIDISEKRGACARGCRLDTFALEEMVGLVGASLDAAPDVVVLNRFGKREAEGHGFRPVIESALDRGIAVLVAVSESILPQWDRFAASLDERLAVDAAAITAWCERQRSPRGTAAEAGRHAAG